MSNSKSVYIKDNAKIKLYGGVYQVTQKQRPNRVDVTLCGELCKELSVKQIHTLFSHPLIVSMGFDTVSFRVNSCYTSFIGKISSQVLKHSVAFHIQFRNSLQDFTRSEYLNLRNIMSHLARNNGKSCRVLIRPTEEFQLVKRNLDLLKLIPVYSDRDGRAINVALRNSYINIVSMAHEKTYSKVCYIGYAFRFLIDFFNNKAALPNPRYFKYRIAIKDISLETYSLQEKFILPMFIKLVGERRVALDKASMRNILGQNLHGLVPKFLGTYISRRYVAKKYLTDAHSESFNKYL